MRDAFQTARLELRGLYDWLAPTDLILNVLFRSAVVVVALAALSSRIVGPEARNHVIVGGSVLAAMWVVVGGATHCTINDRRLGTLNLVLLESHSLRGVLLRRLPPHIALGAAATATTFGVAVLFAGGSVGQINWPPMFLALLVSLGSLACIALIATVAAIVVREVYTVVGAVSLVITVGSGAYFSTQVLPLPIREATVVMPLRWGIAAATQAYAGESLRGVGAELLAEVAVGAALMVTAALLLQMLEQRSRESGSLDWW